MYETIPVTSGKWFYTHPRGIPKNKPPFGNGFWLGLPHLVLCRAYFFASSTIKSSPPSPVLAPWPGQLHFCGQNHSKVLNLGVTTARWLHINCRCLRPKFHMEPWNHGTLKLGSERCPNFAKPFWGSVLDSGDVGPVLNPQPYPVWLSSGSNFQQSQMVNSAGISGCRAITRNIGEAGSFANTLALSTSQHELCNFETAQAESLSAELLLVRITPRLNTSQIDWVLSTNMLDGSRKTFTLRVIWKVNGRSVPNIYMSVALLHQKWPLRSYLGCLN